MEPSAPTVAACPCCPPVSPSRFFGTTSTEMTFFFQIELPLHHGWAGHIVSVFAVTDFVDDDCYIPKLPRPLAGAALESIFFDEYESFFRLLVFRADAAQAVVGYVEKVRLPPTTPVPGRPSRRNRVRTHGRCADAGSSTTSRRRASTGSLRPGPFPVPDAARLRGSRRSRARRRRRCVIMRAPPVAWWTARTPEYSLFVSNALYFFGSRGRQEARLRRAAILSVLSHLPCATSTRSRRSQDAMLRQLLRDP